MSFVSCIVWHLLINNPRFSDVYLKEYSNGVHALCMCVYCVVLYCVTPSQQRCTGSVADTRSTSILLLSYRCYNINCRFINKQLRMENIQTSKTVAMQLFNYNAPHRIILQLHWMHSTEYMFDFIKIYPNLKANLWTPFHPILTMKNRSSSKREKLFNHIIEFIPGVLAQTDAN